MLILKLFILTCLHFQKMQRPYILLIWIYNKRIIVDSLIHVFFFYFVSQYREMETVMLSCSYRKRDKKG